MFTVVNFSKTEGGETMGYRIKEERKKAGLSQEELANASKVSRTIISGLESGRVTTTTTETLYKLAKALNKKVGDIFYTD